jgi:hypothetical protein
MRRLFFSTLFLTLALVSDGFAQQTSEVQSRQGANDLLLATMAPAPAATSNAAIQKPEQQMIGRSYTGSDLKTDPSRSPAWRNELLEALNRVSAKLRETPK